MHDLNLRDYIEYKEGGIFSRVIKSGKYDATLFCMAEGTEMSEHTSAREGFVLIIEGSGVFKLEDNNIEMFGGKMIFMPEGTVHSLKANSNTSFILVLF
ncbi:MAG: cupin domain-containing protein [Candidatus Aenigmarchaeota archaeon]|nr:cupin domain-containing protein [Candidatus Aenigmarchaeota archaeon]